MSAVNILMNPVISCLGAVTFFRVSKLTHCRPKEAVQSGPLPKTLQKANRFCGRVLMATPKHNGLKPVTGELFLETICVSPVVFLAFAAWETPGSGAQRRRTGEGLPCCEGLKKTRGESMLEEGAPL